MAFLRQKYAGRGFTIVELLIGMIVLSILIALLISVGSGVKERVVAAQCLGNVRQLLVANSAWTSDMAGRLPTLEEVAKINYRAQLIPHYLAEELRCPAVPNEAARRYRFGFRYALNEGLRRAYPNYPIRGLPVPAFKVVLVAEVYSFGDGFWSFTHLQNTMNKTYNNPDFPDVTSRRQRHSGGMNLGFLDGHAKLVRPPVRAGTKDDASWDDPSILALPNNRQGLYFDTSQFGHYMKNGRYD